MKYAFRVVFRLTGEGNLNSKDEILEFKSEASSMPLKLCSGTKGQPIGSCDRFSVSGTDINSFDEAQDAAEAVRHALLLVACRTRTGIDLGQNSLRGFGISPHYRQVLAEQLGTKRVLEDHLGVTLYEAEPRPSFIRMNMTGTLSRPADSLTADLSATVGRARFSTHKAETAAGLYALSHFAGRAPAKFLLLFIALEALFEPAPRSAQVQTYIDTLLEQTRTAELAPEERQAIASALSFQRTDSIAATGRKLAASALGEQLYDSLQPELFFAKIYKVRNDLVHRGKIDAESLHVLVGEVDRFVADVIANQAVLS